MSNKVPVDIKKSRSRTLRSLGTKKKHDFYRSFIGKRVPVIVERGARGTSRNYMSVVLPNMNLPIGHEVEVEIKDVNGEHAIGSLRSH
jgi:threonylcarbamoyladenosine tRNA methylthiotransferase MtaB